jgi:sulfur carrier protein
MKVILNGTPTVMPSGATVAHLVADLRVPGEGRGVAVAVDAEVVPRSQWEATPLSDGARVEIVQAVQGG